MVLVALLCIIGAAVLLVGGLGVGGVAQLLARDLLLYPLVPWVLLIGVLGVVSLRMRAAENARRH